MTDARETSARDHSVAVGRDVHGDVIITHIEGEHGPLTPQSLHQIPEPTPTFKGRQEELDELTAAIREGGVAISGVRGMGGIGKTALALKLAQRLTADYPDAQIFVDMDGTSPSPVRPEHAMAHVIHAFHPQLELPTAEGELRGLYRSVLHDKRALLLLDDAADAEQVRPLIPPASCALLVTSRRHFRLPGMHALNLDTLDEEAALDLLCTIAPRIGDCAAEVAELCGCLPMALELAASALAERVDLAPAEYVRRLRDERTRLDLVDASLSLSYDLLSEDLQRLWARLAVFSIPFERKAAAVWEMAEDPAHDRLGELLRYSLVDWKGEIERYQLHDLARVFAYAKLKGREDPRPVRRLAAEYLQAKITDEECGGTPEEALEEVDQWERAEAWEPFARRAGALVGSLDRLGYWAKIEDRLQRALRVVEEHLDEPRLRATLLCDLGTISVKRAEWDHAIACYQKDLEILERVGDEHWMAQTWGNLGIVYRRTGEWDRAIEMYEQARETFERVGDVHGAAQTWMNLGSVYLQKGELDRAIAMYEQSLQTFQSLGDAQGMAKAWMGLGIVYLRKGEGSWAIKRYEQSLEAFEEVGDVHGMAQACGNLATVYQSQGDVEQAADYAACACVLFARLGAALEAQQARQQLVDILGSPEAANAYLAQLAEEQAG